MFLFSQTFWSQVGRLWNLFGYHVFPITCECVTVFPWLSPLISSFLDCGKEHNRHSVFKFVEIWVMQDVVTAHQVLCLTFSGGSNSWKISYRQTMLPLASMLLFSVYYRVFWCISDITNMMTFEGWCTRRSLSIGERPQTPFKRTD